MRSEADPRPQAKAIDPWLWGAVGLSLVLALLVMNPLFRLLASSVEGGRLRTT